MLTPPNHSPPEGPSDKPPARRRYAWQGPHAALMTDYNGPAVAYGWTVTLLGGAVLAQALCYFWLQPVDLQLQLQLQLQLLFGCAVAMLAGLFAVRIPGVKNAFAAGEVFIILETAVGRARMGCDAVRWQGAATTRAPAREEEQRGQRAAARLNRVRSALTQQVNPVVATKVNVHAVFLAAGSGQLRLLASC